jgi:hypothetical protein
MAIRSLLDKTLQPPTQTLDERDARKKSASMAKTYAEFAAEDTRKAIAHGKDATGD